MPRALSPERIRRMLKQDGEVYTTVESRVFDHDVLTEDDLQFVIYSTLLSEFTNNGKWNKGWRVFNRLYLKDEKRYPDLTVFAPSTRATIFIELKHEIERNVTIDDILADVRKLHKIRQDFQHDVICIVFATIWDPDGQKMEKLYGELDRNMHDVEVICLDISRKISQGRESEWLREHANYHGRYRL